MEELRAELHRLLHSMEYAYAMGARRTMGERDPRLDWVVNRVDELEREIKQLLDAERSGRRDATERSDDDDSR
ncbi:MAG TPA: hypothetical protein VGM91_17410 [Conexibacter sp.]